MESATCNLRSCKPANLSLFLLVLFVSIALTLWLYGDGLALPLQSDDLRQVPWAETTRLVDMWRAVGPYGDYRPLHFTLWRLLYLFAGDLSPALLHGLNLVGQALCGTLLGLLVARRVERAWLAAPLAAALLVGFPFAFDAVLWVSSFAYPLTVALALGSLLVYWAARQRDSLPLHLLAVLLTALAGFAYEGGVVTGAMILLAECTLVKWPPVGLRQLRWPLAHLLASALPLALILALTPPSTNRIAATVDNIAVAAQGLAFPLAPLVTLAAPGGDAAALLLTATSLLTVAVLGWVAWRRGQANGFCFGLGWALLWCAIPLLTQHFTWWRDPPRVLTVSAPGVALMWAVVLGGGHGKTRQDTEKRPIPRCSVLFRGLYSIGLVVVLLLPALVFVRGRTALYRRAGDLLWQAVELADTAGQPVLFVNLPGRITPQQRVYPLGHEGVIPMPPATDGELLVRVHTGRAGAAFEREAGATVPSQPYALELAGAPLTPADLRAAARVYHVVYGAEEMELEELGRVLPPQELAVPQVRFAGEVLLLEASCRRVGPEQVVLALRWQTGAPLTGSPTVFAHLLDGEGTLLSQTDSDPLRGLYPLVWWQPGEVVDELRTFHDVPPGATMARLGVWDPAAGVRWEAVTAAGQRLYDDIVYVACE